jgi:hypothetical protein
VSASFSGAIDGPKDSVSPLKESWSWYDDKPSLFGRSAHAFVGPSGKAVVFVHDAEQGGGDCGIGTINEDGTFNVNFAFGNRAIARIVAAKLVVEIPPLPAMEPSITAKPASQLVNFSVLSSTSVSTRIGVSGPRKPVLLRAIGPGLQSFMPGSRVAADPRLSMHDLSRPRLEANDNWESSPADSEVFRQAGAFPLAAGSKDAALRTTIGGDTFVNFTTASDGVGLLEAFDLEPNNDARFTSFAMRRPIPSCSTSRAIIPKGPTVIAPEQSCRWSGSI